MMQMTLMILMITNAYLFTQMKHPMSLGLILLIQTLLTCLISGMMSKTFWFSYILFLIFIGGMLILFMYMSSLSPNMMMTFSMNNLTILFMIFFLFIMLLILDKFYIINIENNHESLIMKNFYMLNSNNLMLSKLYNYPNNFITTLMIMYLLLTLIIIVKISNSFMGPLRKKN